MISRSARRETPMPMTTAPELPFQNLARQANKMMEQFHKGYYNFCPSETWTPSVNLYETAGGYLVCVDLSGVEKEKIDVEVADQRLKLKGNRAVPSTEAIEQAMHAAGEGDPDGRQWPADGPAQCRAHPSDSQHRRLPRHRDATERRPPEEQGPARRSDARRQARRRLHSAQCRR